MCNRRTLCMFLSLSSFLLLSYVYLLSLGECGRVTVRMSLSDSFRFPVSHLNKCVVVKTYSGHFKEGLPHRHLP